MNWYQQGEILRSESVSDPFLVVSKNVYNKTGQAIVCPVKKGIFSSPTTYALPSAQQTIICDQVRHLDLSARSVRHMGEVSLNDIIEISNIIESLFDYY